MTGWHLPGDPYFPPRNEASGGWLSEPASPVSAPPPPPPPMDVVNLVSGDEDEEPSMDSAEGTFDTHDEDAEVDSGSDAPAEAELMEEDTASIPEVRKPRAILRSRHEARPEPSFREYRHPGGPLWMYTPRKRVLSVHCTNPLLTLTPSQGPGPQWVKNVRAWSREQGQTPPRLHLSPAAATNPVYQTLSVVTRRIVRMDMQVRAHTSQIHDVGATAQASTTRLHHVEEGHGHMRDGIEMLQQDLVAARVELQEHCATIDMLTYRVQEAERQVQEARAEIAELRALYATASSGAAREMILID